MVLTIRKTYSFAEIKVDEIETTIFKSDKKEIDDTINNLINIIDGLASYTDKSVSDYVNEYYQ